MFSAIGLTAMLFLLLPASADAQGNVCTISVTGVSFGTYNVFNISSLQSTGGVTFRCGAGVKTDPIVIHLSTGQSSTYNPRALAMGGESLAYNLYVDAARTAIWGDGTNGTSDVTMPLDKNIWISLTIYADIPAAQDVAAGAYTDSVTATVNF
jgi:spore coat protein U-like protein